MDANNSLRNQDEDTRQQQPERENQSSHHNHSSNEDIDETTSNNSEDNSSESSSDYESANEEIQVVLNDGSNDDEEESERRDNVRVQYRRRLTIDPLSDIFFDEDLQRLRDEHDRGEGDDSSGGREYAAGDSEGTADEGDQEQPLIPLPDSNVDFIEMIFGHGINDMERRIEREEEVSNEPLRPARDHAYLPTAQPLYPEEWIPAGRHRLRQGRDSSSGSIDVVMAEVEYEATTQHNERSESEVDPLHHSILPPRDILFSPAPLPNQSYLIPSNIAQHNAVQPTLTILPILELDNVVLFPGSTLPLRLRNSWVEYLGNLIDDARGLYGAHSHSSSQLDGGIANTNADSEVRIGVLPRIKRRTRRRPGDAGARTGRWRVDLIRRGVAPVNRERRVSGAVRRVNGARSSSRTQDDNVTEETTRRQDNAVGEPDSQNETNQEQPSERDDNGEDNLFHSTSSHRSIRHKDSLIGRIGTMATITFTHEETASNPIDVLESNHAGRQSSMVWRRHAGELVVTALGTTRFRIMSCTRDSSTGIPLYTVEEISDGNVAFPHLMAQRPGDLRSPILTPIATEDIESKSERSDDESKETALAASEHKSEYNGVQSSRDDRNNSIWNLSTRSSSPAVAYRTLWPWRISQQICTLLQQTEAFQGIHSALPAAAGVQTVQDTDNGTISVRVVDNSAFANWLGSNLPLDQNNRLDILEMTSVVQQLLYILKKIRGITQPLLRCKYCGTIVSRMSDVFTVGGAEGTTGAYVNEFGVVHQTITVREVDNRGIVAVGYAETKDSW
jgi:hypothetical protein